MKIGIDIGGSHIGVGLVGINGLIIDKKEKEINFLKETNSKQVILDTIKLYITEMLEKNNIKIEEIELIGIAAPGTIKNGVIVKATNLNIENFSIVEELKKEYNKEIKIRNDAKCSALAEKHYGSMKEYSDFVYICLGTGIGTGVIMNNKLLVPKRYEGFELGHMSIDKNGKKCTCGKTGCWEQYASIKAFKENIKYFLKLDENISGEELYNIILENQNNELVIDIINKYLENLRIGIENIINIFEPEAICIGGSFAYYKDLLLDKLIKRIEINNTLFNNKDMPFITTAKLKNDAGIIGAVIE